LLCQVVSQFVALPQNPISV